MSKRTKTLIAAAAAIVVLCGALAAVLLLPSTAPVTTEPETEITSEPDESIILFDKSVDAEGNAVTTPVTDVVTVVGENTIHLGLNDDGALCALRYKDLPLNTVASANVSATLATIKAQKEIGVPENVADFGFDEIKMTVTATYHDGTTFSYEVGGSNPSQNCYYIREVGKQEVYLVDGSYAAYPALTELGYIATAVVTAPVAEADTSTVTNTVLMRDMQLSGSVRKTAFSFQTPDIDDVDFADYSYKVIAPHLHGCNYEIGKTVAGFTSLTASVAAVVHPTAADKTACGFDKPYSVAKFHLAVRAVETTPKEDGTSTQSARYYNVQEHTVSIGSADAGTGLYFMMVDDIDVIYFVNASAVSAWVDLQYDDFVDTLLFTTNITEVDRIEIAVPGKQTTVYDVAQKPVDTAEGSSGSDVDDAFTVTCNGTVKDFSTNEDFRTLYWLALSIGRYGATPETYSTDEKDLVMRYTLYAGGKKEPQFTAAFYVQSGSLYTCALSNGEQYSVKASSVKDFLKYMDMYNNGVAFPEDM